MFTDFLAIIFYYSFGILGAWLLLEVIVYYLSNYISLYDLENEKHLTSFDKWILKVYHWIGIDFESDRTIESRIPFRLALYLGIYAMLGTIAFTISFLFGILSIFFVIVCLLNTKK